MSESVPNEQYKVTIGGDVSGQVGVGHDITQQYTRTTGTAAVTEEDLDEIRRMVDEIRRRVAQEAPADQRDAALERVDELRDAVATKQPDLTTLDYVRSWFGKHLPALAGAITGLIVHPLVGKVVEAAGDLVADEFRRRFGGRHG
jgi:phenylpropionate dioxygenase-like ring-hydroxylating dioxygenase large terminal subunit